jgi:hypothetical protein
MPNESFLHLTPRQLVPGTAGSPAEQITVGMGAGLGFPAGQTSAIMLAARVPESVGLATGPTIDLLLADDPNNADPGRVAVLGVTVGLITSGTSTFDEDPATGPLAGSTEATGTITLAGAPGVLRTLAIAVPVASMPGVGSSKWCLIRIRRLGLDARDAHRGRVVLLGVDIRNT